MLAKKIGQNLIRIREEKGVSVVTLAKAIATPESRILQFEKGLKRPSPEEMLAICKVLNVNISQLLDVGE
ncbi:helix-turn-helix domain-containing protein [Acetobacter sicerae]|uniref:helix-turn-helix domain-containing protein n=1 Tax=Acetobacter sicerae TaxID=85325 RepID=UPI00156ADC22|nr:helix-turn-helix transcriptional regulator [Acetobacter sicerae]NHN93818.1 helix-turn-helix domain-containing protein [Acetobacter sicerae]